MIDFLSLSLRKTLQVGHMAWCSWGCSRCKLEVRWFCIVMGILFIQLLRVVGASGLICCTDCYSQQEVGISVMLRRRLQLLQDTITLFVSCWKNAASRIYVLSSAFNFWSDKGRSTASRNWGRLSKQYEEKKKKKNTSQCWSHWLRDKHPPS